MFKQLTLALVMALSLVAADASAFSTLSLDPVQTDRSSATDMWRKDMQRSIRKLDRRPNLENYKPRPGLFPSSPDAGVNNTPHYGVSKLRNPRGLNIRIGDRVGALGLGFDSGNIYDRHSNMLTSPQAKKARQAVLDFLRDK